MITDARIDHDMISVSPLRAEEWRVNKDLRFSIRVDDGTWRAYVIPKGYITDFASVPRIFWRAAGHPADTETIDGALPHDFCFTHRPMIGGRRITFDESAEMYTILIRKGGANWWQRTLHSFAVRTPFAKAVWNRHNTEFGE